MRPRGNRALLTVLVVGVCLGVVAIGGITWLNHRGSTTDHGANPGAAPPPTTAVPARKKLYGKPPSACSLVSPPALESLYPGAKGEEDDVDTPALENDYYSHECRFSSGGSGDFGIRFMSVRVYVLTGQHALQTNRGTYVDDVAHLSRSVNIRTVEGQKAVRGYGEEAHLIYGLDSENCRTAFLLVRTQNAELTLKYGGCNSPGGMDLEPVDRTTALNGLYTETHEVLTNLATIK
ncbi:hypothetical protein AB0L70_12235 [Kribbella sp. NPDC051952]|uniref:hypothetical protein n=1 Tax=Kribbella sp. NPDC051952 TaxID=3154851 RepID=UPI00343966B1